MVRRIGGQRARRGNRRHSSAVFHHGDRASRDRFIDMTLDHPFDVVLGAIKCRTWIVAKAAVHRDIGASSARWRRHRLHYPHRVEGYATFRNQSAAWFLTE